MASAFHTPDRSALAGAAPARVAPGAPLRRNLVPQSFFTMQPLTDSAADRPFHAARNLANLFQGMSVEQQQALPGPTYEMGTMIRADGSQRPFYEQQPPAVAPVRTNAVVMRKALMESNAPGVESEYIQFDAAKLTPDNVPVELAMHLLLYGRKNHQHAHGCSSSKATLQTRVGKIATFSCPCKCATITVTTL